MKPKEKLELYELKGTLRFYAKNLDDAFRIIGEYYLALSKEDDVRLLGEAGTDIKIRVVK